MAEATSAASQIKKAAATESKMDAKADAAASKVEVDEGKVRVRLLRPLQIPGRPILQPGIHTLSKKHVPASAKVLAKGKDAVDPLDEV